MQHGEDINLRTRVLVTVLIAGQCVQRPMCNDSGSLTPQLLSHFQGPLAGFGISFKSVIFVAESG